MIIELNKVESFKIRLMYVALTFCLLFVFANHYYDILMLYEDFKFLTYDCVFDLLIITLLFFHIYYFNKISWILLLFVYVLLIVSQIYVIIMDYIGSDNQIGFQFFLELLLMILICLLPILFHIYFRPMKIKTA